MGHKVHPKVFRLSTIYTWDSKWFARGKQFVSQLQEDVELREFLRIALKDAGVSEINVERTPKNVTITIHAAKPGFVIGRAGAGIEELKKKIMKRFYSGRRVTLNINVQEIARPMLSAEVVGQQIAQEIERRMPFRRSMKMAIERVMKGGGRGVKLTLSGRLNGAEIARTETIANGSIPLHNLRADVDFARVRATTLQGVVGVKVWIYRGDVFDRKDTDTRASAEQDNNRAPRPPRGRAAR
ncbi:30S ribosomal protein S3 [Patescibacteria group bacterium]|jgi:small subunit ribosomal protein S3|nr:30S ribosomal protein S3 [Patescibacteria group bacterium]